MRCEWRYNRAPAAAHLRPCLWSCSHTRDASSRFSSSIELCMEPEVSIRTITFFSTTVPNTRRLPESSTIWLSNSVSYSLHVLTFFKSQISSTKPKHKQVVYEYIILFCTIHDDLYSDQTQIYEKSPLLQVRKSLHCDQLHVGMTS